MTIKKNQSLDSYFAQISLAIAFVVLFSFGIYRFMTGSYLISGIDLGLSFTVVLMFIQYWKHGHSEKLNTVFVIGITIGISALMITRPLLMLYWEYSMIAVTFFLVRLRVALVINVLSIIVTLGILAIVMPISDRFVSITVTLVLVCVFGYAFSARSDYHENMLKKLATLDGLTGVGNRRLMDEKIEHVITEHHNTQKPYAMIMLDLDHFKKVNDTYGHALGDKALIDFSAIVTAQLGDTDNFYRFGGEEFVIITEDKSIGKVALFAEKIRQEIEKNLRVNNEKTVTVSIGVSEFIQEDCVKSWLNRADEALYKAKHTTRNVVVLAIVDDNKMVKYTPVKAKAIKTTTKKRVASHETEANEAILSHSAQTSDSQNRLSPENA